MIKQNPKDRNQPPCPPQENLKELEGELSEIEKENLPPFPSLPLSGGDPSVFKQTQIYRSYVNPPLLIKLKSLLRWVVWVLIAFWLFFPSFQTIPIDGKVVASQMRKIDVKLDGEMVSIFKSNGSAVKKNEVIGKMRNTFLRNEQQRIEAEIKILEAESEALRQDLLGAEKILISYRRLFEGGDLPRIKLELQEREVQQSQNRLTIKQTEMNERKIRLDNLKTRLVNENILSPFEGIITSAIEEKEHAYLREGDTLCEIASGRKMLEFDVREEALQSLEIGQMINAKFEAFPSKTFYCQVKEIRPLVFEERPKPWLKTYNARVRAATLSPLPETARLGMTAKSQITLKQKANRISKWLQEWKDRTQN